MAWLKCEWADYGFFDEKMGIWFKSAERSLFALYK